MPLLVGQVVIHPHHGPATVLGFSKRTIKDREIRYAQLSIEGQDMTIGVPVESLEEVGLRDVATDSQLNKLADVLIAETTEHEKTWSRRVKAHSSKLLTGDPLRIAEVARDVMRRQEERGISMQEKEILRDAMRPLVAEIAVARGVSEERAEEVTTELILTGSRTVLDEMTAAQPA